MRTTSARYNMAPIEHAPRVGTQPRVFADLALMAAQAKKATKGV